MGGQATDEVTHVEVEDEVNLTVPHMPIAKILDFAKFSAGVASFRLLFFLPFSGGTNKFGITREERREETLQRPPAAAELVTYLPF